MSIIGNAIGLLSTAWPTPGLSSADSLARVSAHGGKGHVDASPPGVVSIDLDHLARAGQLVLPNARTPHAEEFRHMKRQLLKNASSKDDSENNLSLIMVTSALPREGKTFCAINLALSMAAEIDTSVLLVEADVVRPSVMTRLGIESKLGLLDLLSDPDLALSDVILQTNVPKLSILPAGTRHVMSTELLSSTAMASLLDALVDGGAHNRVVIFDAPPLLLTNEAKVLASRMGQVLLVVAASSTPRSAVGEALSALAQRPIVMSILNKARASKLPYGYGHYRG